MLFSSLAVAWNGRVKSDSRTYVLDALIRLNLLVTTEYRMRIVSIWHYASYFYVVIHSRQEPGSLNLSDVCCDEQRNTFIVIVDLKGEFMFSYHVW